MKKHNLHIILVSIALIGFTSCAKIRTLGDLNVISTRNVDVDGSTQYKQLKTYVGLTKKQKRKAKAKDIEEAVNVAVKSVPGGEYLTNAKLYMILKPYKWKAEKRFAYIIEGDVWGVGGDVTMKGFRVGDKVFYSSVQGQKQGVIVELKDDKQAAIRIEGQEKIELVNYEKLTKMSGQ